MRNLLTIFLLLSASAGAHFVKPVQQLDIPFDANYVEIFYEFRNDTDKLIQYLGVVADCDCVQVAVIPEDSAKNGFQPGEVGALNVIMHITRKTNQASLYVQFQSGDVVDTFKISARLNRLTRVALSSDKLYVGAGRSDLIHRVKSMSSSLAEYRLRFDDKAMEARIENEFILVRGLRKGLRKEFVEIVQTKEGKDQVVGILQVNFADER